MSFKPWCAIHNTWDLCQPRREPVPAALERLLHATPGSYIMFTRCEDGSVSLDVTVDDGYGHESASFSEGPTIAAAIAAALAPPAGNARHEET